MADTKRLTDGGGNGIWETTIRLVFCTDLDAPEGSISANPELVLDSILKNLQAQIYVLKVQRSVGGIWELDSEDD